MSVFCHSGQCVMPRVAIFSHSNFPYRYGHWLLCYNFNLPHQMISMKVQTKQQWIMVRKDFAVKISNIFFYRNCSVFVAVIVVDLC